MKTNISKDLKWIKEYHKNSKLIHDNLEKQKTCKHKNFEIKNTIKKISIVKNIPDCKITSIEFDVFCKNCGKLIRHIDGR